MGSRACKARTLTTAPLRRAQATIIFRGVFLKDLFILIINYSLAESFTNGESWARRDSAVVKVLTLHSQHPIWVLVLIPAAPLPFQLPACGPGKQSRTAQSFGTLHPHRRPRRGSWLQIGIASAVVLTWGVNHRREDLPLCLSSQYIRLSNEKIIKNKSFNKNNEVLSEYIS